MSTTTINSRTGRNLTKEAILAIPQGVVASTNSIASNTLTQIGLVLLSKIKEAFLIKAKSGTDEVGDRWAPLKRATVKGKSSKRRILKKSDPKSYNQAMRRLRNIIKGKGKNTKFNKYRNSTKDILIDSGELLDSLSPNSSSKYQVFRIEKGRVIIGTNRPGAMAHHKGVPGRLPQRKLWPDKFPDSWWDEVKDKIVDGIIDTLVDNMRNK